MPDAILKDLLVCFGNKVEIILSCRETAEQSWNKITGTRMDDAILRWMDCVVVACKWVKGKPVEIAVEGIPHAWGNTN